MNVLILGSGGREHVFASKISQSEKCKNLYVAPGNAGTGLCATNVALSPLDFEAIKTFCLDKQIDLILPGNEDPLVAGIVDFVKNDSQINHIHIVGPYKNGAIIEGSKDFSKAFMKKYQIPTAAYLTVTNQNMEEGIAFLRTMSSPYVLKADGLAAGKGVLIEFDIETAISALKDILGGKFGDAGNKVVIEEFLDGIELSSFVLTDGHSYKILPEAKDYKRIGEGDKGLNTGGMGAVSPVPFANKAFMEKVEKQVIIPTIEGFKSENIDYRGFVFIGLMNVGGEPKVIEYNCRMGDPETEVVIHRLQNDFLDLLLSVSNQQLHQVELNVSDESAATVFMVSGGYPESFPKGFEINNLDKVTDTTVYHAGTKQEGGKVLTNGGRVIALTSSANSMEEAIAKSMKAAEIIDYQNKYYRKDIGNDLRKYNEQI
jgi:phosphoribosylamine--glycine ligase